MRDLEIRGAGNLLGDEQSGHVAALGFELYVELLAEAVAELSGERRVAARPVRVDARVDAYVPPDYIASEALKIDLHRRLALSESEDELRELQAATEDRFGPLPEPVENLFLIQEAKLKLARAGADYFVFRGGKATVGPMVLGSEELREPAPPRRHRRLHHREPRGLAARGGFSAGAPTGRRHSIRACWKRRVIRSRVPSRENTEQSSPSRGRSESRRRAGSSRRRSRSRSTPQRAITCDPTNPCDTAFQQATVQPGGSSGWHTHPGATFVAVGQGRARSIASSAPTVPRRRSAWGRALLRCRPSFTWSETRERCRSSCTRSTSSRPERRTRESESTSLSRRPAPRFTRRLLIPG